MLRTRSRVLSKPISSLWRRAVHASRSPTCCSGVCWRAHLADELAARRLAAVAIDPVDAKGLRTAAARAVRAHRGAGAVAWALDGSLPLDELDQIQALVEGAILGGYDAGQWKRRAGAQRRPVHRV